MTTAADLALELIESILKIANKVGRGYTKRWGKLQLPWYDHRFDWARGPAYWMGLEPGVLGHFWMRLDDRVLDLCCGDGMFAGLYFSKKAAVVHGLDRNLAAIELATNLYGRKWVEFFQRNVLEDPFPLEEYDAVMWFQAIEHFSREDCVELIKKIKRHLHPEGFLFGSTVLGHATGNPEHKVEFLVSQDLRELLEPHFDRVKIRVSRRSEERTDLFFHCSGGTSDVGKVCCAFSENRADEVLEEFDDICKSLSIDYYLIMGTCLSFYRDGGYFPHEHDLDVLPTCSDSEFVCLVETLKQREFTFRGTPKERPYGHCLKNGILLDIWREADANAYGLRKVEHTFFQSFDTVIHRGRSYRVPRPVEDYLEFVYRADWRIPRP